ncbi:hypothetical protein GCM10010840_36210 [Deinococcus aerolatus]|uniref:Tetratricopeptide repeat protein n=1 Tax=Deinococcus aerolatus TaxID=522487 RepID=A0ABQ2GHJ4_9DEIO|nr:tetratricopeptide repeat protein [Deinococcus aerolatus]GGL94920.1 hypothetical protein GCM10010840_36210 [Deinococcus aerolatus]
MLKIHISHCEQLKSGPASRTLEVSAGYLRAWTGTHPLGAGPSWYGSAHQLVSPRRLGKFRSPVVLNHGRNMNRSVTGSVVWLSLWLWGWGQAQTPTDMKSCDSLYTCAAQYLSGSGAAGAGSAGAGGGTTSGGGGSGGGSGGAGAGNAPDAFYYGDSQVIMPLEDHLDELQAGRLVLCRPDASAQAPKDFAAALAQADAAAYAKVPNAPKVKATLQQSSEDHNLATAAAGMRSGRPQAALAALLAVYQRHPQSPDVLVNVAATLNSLGLPALSLAFLQQAEGLKVPYARPLGWDGRAIALNNRGYALLLLGRWKEAETVLQDAVKREPLLSEAKRNLAWALLCQNLDKQAAQQYRLGLRRAPSTAQANQTDIPLEQLPPGTKPALETLTVRRESLALFDLSKGKKGKLPDLKIPDNSQTAAEMQQAFLEKVMREGEKEITLALRRDGLQAEAEIRLNAYTNPVSKQRAEDLLYAIEMVNFEPAVQKAYRQMTIAHDELLDAVGKAPVSEAVLTRMYEILGTQEQAEALPLIHAMCLPEFEAHYNKIEARVHNYDHDFRQYFSLAHQYRSALATNIQDAKVHAFADAIIQTELQSAFVTLMGAHVMAYATGVYREAVCLTAPSVAVSVTVSSAPEESTSACPDELKGLKVSLEWQMLNISMTCENVEITVATAGPLGAFTKVNKTFLGSTTVAIGVRAGVSVPVVQAGAGVEAGVYLTVDRAGGLQDVGIQGAASAGLGLVHASGPLSVSKDVAGVGAGVTLGLVSGIHLN